jgi:Tfp pilus tip-associated adhesin PilY1
VVEQRRHDTTYYIAGLAYGAHVNDIRPDLTGTQNISTYWMDVMEYQTAADLNPYYLATKYGGFSVPANYDPANHHAAHAGAGGTPRATASTWAATPPAARQLLPGRQCEADGERPHQGLHRHRQRHQGLHHVAFRCPPRR